MINTISTIFSEVNFCPKCDRKYKYKYTLTKDLKYECGVAPKFQCSICKKLFKQKTNLKLHLLSVLKIIILKQINSKIYLLLLYLNLIKYFNSYLFMYV